MSEGEYYAKNIIDEEFKALLPALDKETYDMLEANLILKRMQGFSKSTFAEK